MFPVDGENAPSLPVKAAWQRIAGRERAGREKYPAIEDGAKAMSAYQQTITIGAGFRRMTVAR
jgi:hypothetical protein